MTDNPTDDRSEDDQSTFECPGDDCEEGFDSSRELLSHVVDDHDASEIDLDL